MGQLTLVEHSLCPLDPAASLVENLVHKQHIHELTHKLENLVLKIQQGEVSLSTPVVTVLLLANDTLAAMLVATEADLTATFDNTAVLAQIQACIAAAAAESWPLPPSINISSGNWPPSSWIRL